MPYASFPPRGDRPQPPDLNRRSRSGQLTFGQTEFSMKHLLTGGALALALFASHAAAQDEGAAEITVDAPLLHPAAGLMNDHMHEGGEVMVGLRLERSRWSGANRSGTEALSDAAIAAAGYTARTASMEMDMAMLDLMFAPNDDLTLMVMPMYMRHRMTMVGIDPAGGAGGGHGGHGGAGHALGLGETHAHGIEGFGDTLVSASYRLARSPGFGAHATLGVWLPTGSADRTNADGTFVHYGMQPGSGTWDVEPSLTVHGREGPVGWGAQAGYRWRTESANGSGFAFGDVARTSGWASYLLAADLGATARVEWRHEGQIEGHYAGAHHHTAPPDRQENYGGDTVSAGLGLNWLLPVGGAKRPQLGAEFSVPLHQDLNGIQAPQDWRFSLSLGREF